MRRGFAYERISDDREGLALGVKRQHTDLVELASSVDVEVVEWFRDNDIGASTRSRKRRPNYAEMLRRAWAGEVDVILAYSNSRLTRRPREVEDLIELAEKTRIKIITKVSGEDDLSTADGRMIARIKGNVDTGEAERIGERVGRKHLELAQNGIPVGGRRAFGWKADKRTLDPTEAALARAAITAIIEGATLMSVVRGWNAQGVRTVMGKEWTTSVLRQYLTNPRLAGVRCLHGVETEGKWEPLISRTEFDVLQAVVVKPETRSRVPRRGARQHMLTGIVRCSICNSPMYGNNFKGGFNYACHTSKGVEAHSMAVSGQRADELVEKLYLARMEREQLDSAQVPVTWPGEGDLADAEAQIKALMAAFRAKQLSAEVVFPQVQELEAEVVKMRKGRTDWLRKTSGPAPSRVTPQEWKAKSAPEKNAALEKVLDAVLVLPSGGSKRFSPERLVPVWRAAQRSTDAAQG